MADNAQGTAATGTHEREGFVRVFFAIFRNQHSGVLDVKFGKRTRTLYFLGGYPIAYRSDLPEDELERLIRNLEQEMRDAAVDLRFEYAARLRDEVKDLKRELREMR